MPREYRLSIITVNYNGLHDTCELIDSIPPTPGMEIIVVDNGSRQDEASLLSQRYPHVRALRSETNLGFAGGNNLGIQAARGQYLFFINNDTLFLDDWHIDTLIARLEKDETIGMVCPKIRFTWGDRLLQFAGFTPLSSITLRNRSIGTNEVDNGQYDRPRPTPYAHGAAMLVRHEAIDRVGPMPECYFLYYEELDWSLLFRRAGYDIWYDPCTTIYHKESQSTGQNSSLKTYYMTRNRLLFAQRNIPSPQRWLTYLYLIGLVVPRDIVRFTLSRAFPNLRATCSGVVDFIRGKCGYHGRKAAPMPPIRDY